MDSLSYKVQYGNNNAKNLKRKSDKFEIVVWKHESPDGWLEILKEANYSRAAEFAVSPLHDKDVRNGEPVLPHWHIALEYSSSTTVKHIYELFCEPIGAGLPIPIRRGKAVWDYLTHEGEPEKHHYSKEDIVYTSEGFDPAVFCKQTVEERTQINLDKYVHEVMKEHKRFSYQQIADYFAFTSEDDAYLYVRDHSWQIDRYGQGLKKTVKAEEKEKEESDLSEYVVKQFMAYDEELSTVHKTLEEIKTALIEDPQDLSFLVNPSNDDPIFKELGF